MKIRGCHLPLKDLGSTIKLRRVFMKGAAAVAEILKREGWSS
jgi:hypothetical protein